MKKELGKKKLWGSAAVLLILVAVLTTLVGFGSGPDLEEHPSASPSPTLSIASSTAKPVPTAKPVAKTSAASKVKAESEVSHVEELQEAKAETKWAALPAESKAVKEKASSGSAEASASSSTPPVPAVNAVSACPTPAPTQAPTPKPKEKVWVVDVPVSTQQIWVDEQGHWEDKTYLTSDWVYQCNGCGQTFPSTADVDAHQWAAFDNGEDHGGYTMVSGPMYEASEKVWVVDIEGHYETVTTPEQGHWEYK